MASNIEVPPDQPHGPFFAEGAPSEYRSDEPTFARVCGMLGLGLAFFGLAILVSNAMWGQRLFTPIWGQIAVVLGAALMLFHAARDGDTQIRRTYGTAG